MKKLLILILIFTASITYAEDKDSLHFVPKAKTQIEVLKELFVWIPTHIKYDVEALYSLRSPNTDTSADVVLRDGKGLCLGWSLVFQKYVKEYLGLPCQVVYVALRDSAWIKHAINAVFIDDKWYYFDVTWGGGKLSENENEFAVKIDWDYFMFDELQVKKYFIILRCNS